MVKSWEDLDVWKAAHALTNEIYDLVMTFPSDERYSLTQQLKRAAWSMTANIVEGFNRLSAKDKVRFYNVSLCSTQEVKYGLMLARDRKFCPDQRRLCEHADRISRMLSGLINAMRRRRPFSTP